MLLTKRFVRPIAKWIFVLGCLAMCCKAIEPQALGHYPFRHHHHHGHHHHGHHHRGWGSYGVGSYGWGSAYYGGYSSFYGLGSSYYNSSYYPSLSFYYTPRYYSVNYYAPYVIPYTPTFYSPYYYGPTYAPCTTWGVNYDFGFPLSTNDSLSTFPALAGAASGQLNSPLAMQTRASRARTPFTTMQVANRPSVEQETRGNAFVDAPGIKLVSRNPSLLQPYSPIWTKAAVGIVDDMIAAGELENAHTSCKSMERITQPKGAGVYLRQGLLNYFATDDASSQSRSTEGVLLLLEKACSAGSQVHPSELAKDSLGAYFATCPVNVVETMDRLSKSILESRDNSEGQLLLLAALLKLDGQADRAKLFASEVQQQVAMPNSFRWNNLLDACLN